MRSEAVQYTIRGIPPEVDKALRERAQADKKSINQVILDALAQATVGKLKYRDLSDVAGTMKADPELDRILEEQRQIDMEDWE
jgi:hypothetical protein